MNLIHDIEQEYMKKEIPAFNVGDTVNVETIIREMVGEGVKKALKERRQIFAGVVISIKGCGLRRTFTVRRIVQGEGVERVFPFHSPFVADVKIKKHGVVRRAKLYYLQQRSGKSARIKERILSAKPQGSRSCK